MKCILRGIMILMGVFSVGMPIWVLAGNEGEKAQTPSLKALTKQGDESYPVTIGPFLTSGALPMGKGNFGIQPYWFLSFRAGEFSPSWRRVSAGGDYISLTNAVTLYYGITDKLWASIFLPYYVHNWAMNVNVPGPMRERNAQSGGPSNMTLTLRYLLRKQQGNIPTCTGLFTLTFPIRRGRTLNPGRLGADDLGTSAWVFTGGLNLHQYAQPFIVYANLWYSMSTTDTKKYRLRNLVTVFKKSHPRDQIIFNLAAEYPLGWKGPWVILVELNSFWEVGPIIEPKAESKPVSLVTGLVGVEYMYSARLRFGLGVSFDMFGKNFLRNYTPIFTFYTPISLFK